MKPALLWLIDRLAVLNPPETHPGDHNAHVIDRHAYVVDYHAYRIWGHWLTWRYRSDNTAIKIKGALRPYAKRVPASAGATRELKRLLTAARRSNKQYIKAWLGASGEALSRIEWPPVPPVTPREIAGKVHFERASFNVNHTRVEVRGYRAIMPRRIDAVPLIEAALAGLKLVRERSRRKPDALADDLARAVCVAYFALTRSAGISWNAIAEKYEGGLIELARDIRARFGAGPLSINRLRKNNFRSR